MPLPVVDWFLTDALKIKQIYGGLLAFDVADPGNHVQSNRSVSSDMILSYTGAEELEAVRNSAMWASKHASPTTRRVGLRKAILNNMQTGIPAWVPTDDLTWLADYEKTEKEKADRPGRAQWNKGLLEEKQRLKQQHVQETEAARQMQARLAQQREERVHETIANVEQRDNRPVPRDDMLRASKVFAAPRKGVIYQDKEEDDLDSQPPKERLSMFLRQGPPGGPKVADDDVQGNVDVSISEDDEAPAKPPAPRGSPSKKAANNTGIRTFIGPPRLQQLSMGSQPPEAYTSQSAVDRSKSSTISSVLDQRLWDAEVAAKVTKRPKKQ